LLNGVGSAGKGSIAKALQTITSKPFLHVQMDAFLEMLPEASFGRPDGLAFETVEEDGKPSVIIRTGPVAERAFRGMRHAVAAMAAQGNDLISTTSCWEARRRNGGPAVLDLFRSRLRPWTSSGPTRTRHRMVGLARWQYDRVHKDMTYDLEVTPAPRECAS
jgi:chloramphenicol 3-O phosphotransferase